MIEVLHLFPELNDKLIDVLSGLDEKQWRKPTVCKLWTVKDIAAHLLDTSLRRLSAGRDNYRIPFPVLESNDALISHLNAMNASWVEAWKRVSPAILVQQISTAQEQLYHYLLSLDYDGEALFPVSWAGETLSRNWFDIAREYTERWLHQQQIREAVGAPGLLTRELYFPFLNTLMQALPYTYNRYKGDATEGTIVQVDIIGNAGGAWKIIRNAAGWSFTNAANIADVQVYIDEQIAWLLFSKAVDAMEARQFWQVLGDTDLGLPALKMVSVMA